MISPESQLDEVVEEMAAKKYGSAIVEQNGKVVASSRSLMPSWRSVNC